jgi:hypothetical protein
MPTKTVATSEPRDQRPRRTTTGRADAATLADALDRLRDAFLNRLDKLEDLAAEQAARLDQSSSEREQTLRERIAVLEASQARLQAELKRREQEWLDSLRQIEDDRHLLAEAWERLERERVDVAPESRHGAATNGGSAVVPGAAATFQPPAAGVGDIMVTREILKQFQALRGDVRRNASGPGRGAR